MTRDERQRLGIQKWVNSGCRGTLMWCTGVGKTRAALISIKSYLNKNTNTKVLVVVPTEHLKIQWMQELAKFGLFHDVSVSIINSAIKFKEKVDFLVLDNDFVENKLI